MWGEEVLLHSMIQHLLSVRPWVNGKITVVRNKANLEFSKEQSGYNQF